MKNVFFSLAFVLVGSFAFGSLNVDPKLSKLNLGNLEVLNLDKAGIGEYLFKRNQCETGGFSFFSPFYEVNGLAFLKVNSKIGENDIQFSVDYDDKSVFFKITNIEISDDKSNAYFDVEHGNMMFKSSFTGENLSLEFLRDSFSNPNETSLLSIPCPPCVYVAIVVVTAAVTKVCVEASQACSPCNGTLVVGACSCSCTPKN